MNDAASQSVMCEEHGKSHVTFLCEHLAAKPKQEWFSREPSKENPWPDAWCSVCDVAFMEQGEWNEHNESAITIKILCNHCYENMRRQEINP